MKNELMVKVAEGNVSNKCEISKMNNISFSGYDNREDRLW